MTENNESPKANMQSGDIKKQIREDIANGITSEMLRAEADELRDAILKAKNEGDTTLLLEVHKRREQKERGSEEDEKSIGS